MIKKNKKWGEIKLNQGSRAMTKTRKSEGYSMTKTTRASTNCLVTIVRNLTPKETKLTKLKQVTRRSSLQRPMQPCKGQMPKV